ncbi:hypothetical protein NHX12_029415, partial [Muraenolepis orangiensis]
ELVSRLRLGGGREAGGSGGIGVLFFPRSDVFQTGRGQRRPAVSRKRRQPSWF